MPGHWTILLLGLIGVLLYAVVMPSMMVSQIDILDAHHKVVVTLASDRARLTGSKAQLPGSSTSSRRELTFKGPQQQPSEPPELGLTWQRFWGTDLEQGGCN